MLVSIQILRALAAWLVVGHHVTQLIPEAKNDSAASQVFALYGAYGVDLFFVISGLVIYLSSTRRQVSPREFFLQRVARVVPAYWIFSALIAVTLFLDHSLVFGTKLEWPFFFKSLLFVPAQNPSGIGRYPLLTVGWTLNYEIAFYGVYLFAMFAPTKLRTASVTIGVLLLVFAVPKFGGVLAFYGNKIVLEFLLGVAVGVAAKRGLLAKVAPMWGAVLCLAGLVAIWVHGGGKHSFLGVGLPCAALVVGAISLEKYVNRTAFVGCLGDWSYSTYLCHVLVLSIGYRVYQVYTLPLFVVLIASILVIGLVSFVSYSFVEDRLATAIRRYLNHWQSHTSLA